MITTPEIICDLFSFLDKDRIERIQLVNQLWNNVVIRYKNILPLRQFYKINFLDSQIWLFETQKDCSYNLNSYRIKFDGTNMSEIGSSSYSQLTVDEALKNLNDVVFDFIKIYDCSSEDGLDKLLNLLKLVTTKTGGRFLGKFGSCAGGRFCSKLNEIFDNYITVDKLTLGNNSYIREVCAHPEIVQLPSTPKEIRLARLEFKNYEKVLNFTCNGKLNRANRVTIKCLIWGVETNYENFIRQWFELYRTHENPISLVGKFEPKYYYDFDSALDAIKTFLNNAQLHIKYSLETKKFHIPCYGITNQYVKRSCVLHETDSYALVIGMEYTWVTDISSINASDLDQPPCDKIKKISLCVKSL